MMERSLQDAVLRLMIPDIEAVPKDDRGMPEDIEHLKRSFETTRVASFEQEYRENSAIEWNIVPQGTLPNITNMVDGDGNPVLWADHATEVDLNDPFFQTLHVKVGVNADFAALPIHSIEVKLEYKHGGAAQGRGVRVRDRRRRRRLRDVHRRRAQGVLVRLPGELRRIVEGVRLGRPRRRTTPC